MSARPRDRRGNGPPRVGEQVEQLGDPETSPVLPVGAIAVHAAEPAIEDRRVRRRRTDREIWSLAWPVILSQVLVSLVSLVDIAMVGRLGRDAVAAVGYATQYVWLTQSVLFAVGIACVAMMARAIGAGQVARARRAFAASLVVAVAIAGVITAVVLIFPGPLLRLLDAQTPVVSLGIPYFRLTVGSSLLLAVAITIESALRADRDTITPMRIAGVAALVKIALNAVLIFGTLGFPRLELVGAGVATVISQAIALALFVGASVRADHHTPASVHWRDVVECGPLLRQVVQLSLPAVGERVVMNFAMMSYFTLLGQYGTAAIAAYTIGIRVLSFSWIPGIGFSVAAATLVGQSLGARDPRAAARAGWRAARLALLVSILLGLLYAAGRNPVGQAFTNDASVIAELLPFIVVLALAQPLMGLHFTLGGALRGAGDTWTPLVAAAIGNWVFRVPIAFVCASVLSAEVIFVWYALILDHLARAAWLAAAFHRGRWRRKLGSQA